MPALHMSQPRLFRTYTVRENRSYDCPIWQAARATSAAPTFFKRIRIGEKGLEEEFIDGGLGCNNPVKQVLEETEAIFGSGQHVACIISIGCGQAGVVGLKSPDAFQKALPLDLITVLRQIATNCESAAEEIEKRFQNIPNVYFRFNVDQGMQGVTLADGEKLGEVTQHTMQYIQKLVVNQGINAAVDAIREQRATVKSTEISMWNFKFCCDHFSLFVLQMVTSYLHWTSLNRYPVQRCLFSQHLYSLDEKTFSVNLIITLTLKDQRRRSSIYLFFMGLEEQGRHKLH
jgi:predicted acylesterase/phospholipase RssA